MYACMSMEKRNQKNVEKRNHSVVEAFMDNAKCGGNMSHAYVSEWKL